MRVRGRVVSVSGDARELVYIVCDDGEWRDPPPEVARLLEERRVRDAIKLLEGDEYLVVGWADAVIARKSCVEKVRDLLEVFGFGW